MTAYKNKVKTLKTIKKFELLNRLACYACVIPFFYTASCLGQKQTVPSAAKVGSIGFVATVVAAVAIRQKEEKTKSELDRIAKQNCHD